MTPRDWRRFLILYRAGLRLRCSNAAAHASASLGWGVGSTDSRTARSA
jgi:hypothetical protein